jgi:hypothetical protein
MQLLPQQPLSVDVASSVLIVRQPHRRKRHRQLYGLPLVIVLAVVWMLLLLVLYSSAPTTLAFLVQKMGHHRTIIFRRDWRRRRSGVLMVSLDKHSNYDDDDLFDVFVKMRTGVNYSASDAAVPDPTAAAISAIPAVDDGGAVFWAGSGALYEAYSGRILAKFEGFDVGRGIVLHRNDNDDANSNNSNDRRPSVVRQLSRKIFWFRDPNTNEVFHSFKGEPVVPIMYEYQAFDYYRPPTPSSAAKVNSMLGNQHDEVVVAIPKVVSGPRNVPVSPITGRTVLDDVNTVLFQAPVFCDLDLGTDVRYQAWEFYDYNVDRSGERPPSAVWCRQGNNPPFVPMKDNSSNAMGVLRFVGSRVNQFDHLPQSIQQFIASDENAYGLFRRPPADMAEIEQLEKVAAEKKIKR